MRVKRFLFRKQKIRMTKKKAFHWLPDTGRILVVLLFFSGLFFRCANVTGTLEGGPKDTLPPRVLRMTPVYNATGISPSRIVIEFDEYIQLKDMQQEFFTSPFMEKKPVVSYKNRSAIITIDSPLDSATTYVLNLGSGVVDNNEGNPIHGLKYTFSTGGHIDSMYMSGYVSNALTADTMKGAYIFFYDAALDTDPERDSLLFDTWRASAVSRTLTDGGFIHSNLRPIDYRVYALVDKNSNQMYDPGVDEVAFLDSVRNPSQLPSFLMWYDSVRMHMVAQPQLFFRTFVEKTSRPQNLTSSTRPSAQQVLLQFASPDPLIEHITLNDIPTEKILTEYLKETRDSILLWLDVPADELPDTLRGTIAYERPDSVGQPYLHEQDLRLVWSRPFVAPAKEEQPESERPPTRRELRRAAKAAAEAAAAEDPEQAVIDEIMGEAPDSLSVPADTVPPSKMKYSFTGGNPVIPGEPPVMQFELPVHELVLDSIRLFRTEGEEEVPLEFEFEQDSLLIRDYRIRAEWQDGQAYRLFIPPRTVETIDGERNDSISQSFQVAAAADMASVTLHLVNPPADYEYIVQVTDEKGTQVLREVAHLGAGSHEIEYLEKGNVRLRLIEDRNRNGKWDTGDLVRRVQPEQVAWYATENEGTIDLQGPVELEEIDVTALFRPRVHRETPPEGSPEEEVTEGEAASGEAGAVVQDELREPEPGQPVWTSEARVEDFELTDLKAAKRAERTARRAARAAAKEERRAARQEKAAHDRDDDREGHDHDH